MIRPIRLLASFLTVGGWTLISRVLGLVRDLMIAAFLGSGPAAQAFLVALSLPNMFRRFFAEGAFNTAFVPMYAKKIEGDEDAQAFANDAYAALAGVLVVFTVLATLAMPWLVWAMASGFASDGRFDLAVAMGRVTFPYILFISLAALLSGVLNSIGRFAAAAAAPILLNLFFITAMLLAARAGWDVAWAITWAVPLAGVAQLTLLWWAVERAGIKIRPRMPRITPDLKRLGIVALPAMLAGGVMQINLIVGRQVASYFDGAVAWLSYADRLYQLPLGLVGVAIGVVLLPSLSRHLASDDTAGGREAFNRANEFALMLTVPAAVALVTIPVPIVSVLFERGAFDAIDTQKTALAAAIYGAGLPAFVLQKTYQPLYFARSDTRTPFKFAAVAMVVNAVLAISLSVWIGFAAAALGTTLSAWVMWWLLARGARRFGAQSEVDEQLRSTLGPIFAASAIMGVAAYGFAWVIGDWLTMAGWRYLALMVLVLVSAAVYVGALWALGGLRLSALKAALRREA